jgi:hypothetical protein
MQGARLVEMLLRGCAHEQGATPDIWPSGNSVVTLVSAMADIAQQSKLNNVKNLAKIRLTNVCSWPLPNS